MVWTIAMERGALALLLAGAGAGVAGGQTLGTAPTTHRTGYCPGGLFTLTGGTLSTPTLGTVKFHVALDDRRSGPDGLVLMRLIDHEGTVVKAQTVLLRPGESATLEHAGFGLYRAQAETFESVPNVDLSDRRRVVGTVELFDVDNFRAVIPVFCTPNENIGR